MKTSDALKLALQGVKKYVDNSINTNSIVRPYEIFRVEETIFGKTGYIDVETMEPSVKYGLAEEYLDCSSFAFVIPTATTPYAIMCISASFQVSDLMVTEKWEGDPSKGEEGLYIIARGLNEDYKINIRHKESKDGVTVEVIRNTRYLHISNTKEFIPTGDYNPATKKYVDDAIQENGFSGDYNDLTNKPVRPSIQGLASESYVNNAVTQLNDNLQGQIDDLFQNVSNGKELIASAITDKGVDASKEETFQSLSEKINQIPVGPPGSNIIGYINEENDIYVSLTELESGTYTLKFEDYYGLLDDFDDIGNVEVE